MQCANPSSSSAGVSTLLYNSRTIRVSNSQSKFSIAPSPRSSAGDNDWDGGDAVASPLPLPSHVKSISSPSNPFVKHCLKLRHNSSYRHSHGCVLLVGTTPIREISRYQKLKQQKPISIDCLLLLDGAEVPDEFDDLSVRIVRVSSVVMKKLSGMQSIESIEAIALMRIPSSFCNMDNQREVDCQSWFPCPHRVIVLDGIQDPGNIGTLVRSAMAFGWGGVFLLPGCCDPFNEKALRAARELPFRSQLSRVIGFI